MSDLTPEYLAAMHDAAGAVADRLATDVNPAGGFAVTGQIEGAVRYLCYTDTLGGAETIRTLLQEVPVLLAEVDRLRAEVSRVKADADDEFNEMMAEWESVNKSRTRLQVKNDKLRAAVQRVRDLHVRTTDYDPDLDQGGPDKAIAWCQHCASDHWPCETIRAIDGEWTEVET